MKVGVLCEFSGIVRDAFTSLGHDATSCDFLPSEAVGKHIIDNCLNVDWSTYDLLICHPPCTYITNAGARWWPKWHDEQAFALEFVQQLLSLPVPRIALENPRGLINVRIRKPDQTVQPWMFGDKASKRICLWLKNLPLLVPTNIVPENSRAQYTEWVSPGPDRWKIRSRTHKGFARAMAEQWGIF